MAWILLSLGVLLMIINAVYGSPPQGYSHEEIQSAPWRCLTCLITLGLLLLIPIIMLAVGPSILDWGL